MKKTYKPSASAASIILSLALILSLLLSACGSSEPPKGAMAYWENAMLPQTPFDVPDAEAVETLLHDIYICEGDSCGFRSPGLADGLHPKMDKLLYLYLLAEESGLNDEPLQASVKRVAGSGLRKISSFSLSDAAAALSLERLVLQKDNGTRIEEWLQSHSEEKTGLLISSGATFSAGGPSGDALEWVLYETGMVIDLLNRGGISLDTERFHAGARMLYDDYVFKFPEEGKDMMESGGVILFYMPTLGIDVTPYSFWWEAWQDAFLNKTIDNNDDLGDILGWTRIATAFGDDSLQHKLDDYLRNTDFTQLLEYADADLLYNLLHGILGDFPLEKRQALMDYCRRKVQRYEEVLLAPTIRDSFYGASLAVATGFTVDWEKLLTCCGTMLKEEQAASDHSADKLLHDLYYFAMLTELLKDSVQKAAYESALELLKKCVKASAEEALEHVTGQAQQELCEVMSALGISKDRKLIEEMRSDNDYWLDFTYNGRGIKYDSLYVDVYRVDQSCGFNQISTDDLQEMITNLSLDGVYAYEAYDETVANLEASFWISCLRTRNEALSFTAEELSMLSQQAALHFGSAMESSDLAELYYYLCLKYCTAGTSGGTP